MKSARRPSKTVLPSGSSSREDDGGEDGNDGGIYVVQDRQNQILYLAVTHGINQQVNEGV